MADNQDIFQLTYAQHAQNLLLIEQQATEHVENVLEYMQYQAMEDMAEALAESDEGLDVVAGEPMVVLDVHQQAVDLNYVSDVDESGEEEGEEEGAGDVMADLPPAAPQGGGDGTLLISDDSDEEEAEAETVYRDDQGRAISEQMFCNLMDERELLRTGGLDLSYAEIRSILDLVYQTPDRQVHDGRCVCELAGTAAPLCNRRRSSKYWCSVCQSFFGGRVADRYIGLEGDSQPEEYYELQQRLISEWEQTDRRGLIPVLDFVPAVASEEEEAEAMEDGAEE